MKNNKGITYIGIILIIIGVLAVGGIAYYAGRSISSDSKNIPARDQTNSSNSFNWNSFPKTDFEDIVSKNKDLYFVPEEGLSLSQAVDLTGDGIEEAIVSGNGGNNDVSFILIRDSGGAISIAQQKEKLGTILPVSLLEIGRVNYQNIFKLLPNEHGFYTASLTATGIDTYGCNPDSVNAYVWNPATELFEWDQTLSTKYAAQVCK